MAKELYLYSPIYDFVAESFISQMDENKTEDVDIRANTPGGNVFAGWGMIAKIKEHEGKVKMKVDGYVASMGTILLAYVDDTEALDVSRVHLHRADGYVNSPEDQAFLDGINKDLRSKLTSKIDADKFKEVTGKTIDDLFDPKERIDVWLTARQAKQVGLIKKIVKLNPTEIAAINRMSIAASLANPPKNEETTVNNKTMTLEEIKAQHPALYAQILAEGKTAGSTEGAEKERNRIKAWEAFRHIDAAKVDEGVKSGKEITVSDMAEFNAKALSPEALKKLAAEAAPAVSTTEVSEKEKTEKEKKVSDFAALVNANLGRKPAAQA